jgi:DNA replication protein DnaC
MSSLTLPEFRPLSTPHGIYDKGSLIITSQVPVDRWHDMIGSPTLADAILDRVIHNAYRIDLTGESLRKTRAPS